MPNTYRGPVRVNADSSSLRDSALSAPLRYLLIPYFDGSPLGLSCGYVAVYFPGFLFRADNCKLLTVTSP
jgi:hypothetical protein